MRREFARKTLAYLTYFLPFCTQLEPKGNEPRLIGAQFESARYAALALAFGFGSATRARARLRASESRFAAGILISSFTSLVQTSATALASATFSAGSAGRIGEAQQRVTRTGYRENRFRRKP
jgi:hypothetical protein